MQDAAIFQPFGLPRVRQGKPPAVPLPAPNPFRHAGPVLIGDAVTPAGGETLLSLLLRRPRDD